MKWNGIYLCAWQTGLRERFTSMYHSTLYIFPIHWLLLLFFNSTIHTQLTIVYWTDTIYVSFYRLSCAIKINYKIKIKKKEKWKNCLNRYKWKLFVVDFYLIFICCCNWYWCCWFDTELCSCSISFFIRFSMCVRLWLIINIITDRSYFKLLCRKFNGENVIIKYPLILCGQVIFSRGLTNTLHSAIKKTKLTCLTKFFLSIDSIAIIYKNENETNSVWELWREKKQK